MMLAEPEQGVSPSVKWSRTALAIALVLGTFLRVAWIARPLDHRSSAEWREADYVQIARNFYREDGNILFPRIDWRGDTPGYVESELPLMPWLAAQIYRMAGYDLVYFRALAVAASVASLLVFAGMARGALPPDGAWFATASFAISPWLVRMGNALQPEPLMILLSLLAVRALWKWSEEPGFGRLLRACAWAAAAMLAKMSAGYVGFVFAHSLLRRLGLGALRDVRVYLAAAVALAPPLVWGLWARHFWTAYGNSLGVSNETHLITWKALWPPAFLAGNLRIETLFVWSPLGLILGVIALQRYRSRLEPLLAWYGAVWSFYLIAANTSGDRWAAYYHSASVAPVSLIMGAGFSAGVRGLPLRRPTWLTPRLSTRLLATATLLSLATVTAGLVARRDTRPDEAVKHACAVEFSTHVPPHASIVVSGGGSRDGLGQPVAWNESTWFAWMDRRGFQYAFDDFSAVKIEGLRRRGGRYWIASAHELERPDIVRLLDSNWKRVATCGDYTLHEMP